jgi:hypothetical protein
MPILTSIHSLMGRDFTANLDAISCLFGRQFTAYLDQISCLFGRPFCAYRGPNFTRLHYTKYLPISLSINPAKSLSVIVTSFCNNRSAAFCRQKGFGIISTMSSLGQGSDFALSSMSRFQCRLAHAKSLLAIVTSISNKPSVAVAGE